jgi:transcriptional regulator with XRE-family HTH domain
MDKVRSLRRSKGLNQAHMAFELKISTSYYSKLERVAEEITLSRLLNICRILEISIVDLLADLVEKQGTVQEGRPAYPVKPLSRQDLLESEQNILNGMRQLLEERLPGNKATGKKPGK